MMKKLLPILIIIALILFGAFFLDFGYTKKVDWEESFNEKSNKPYGLSIFYNELPNLFKNQKIRTVYYQPSSYFNANRENSYGDHVAKGLYMIIGNSDYLEDESVDSLLSFARDGNTLFISDYYFAQKFHDTLDIDVDYDLNETDSISFLTFKNKKLNSIKIDRNDGDYYFSYVDTIANTVLGYSKIDTTRINFVKIPFGKGNVFLHLEPKVFTNY